MTKTTSTTKSTKTKPRKLPKAKPAAGGAMHDQAFLMKGNTVPTTGAPAGPADPGQG